MGEVNVGDEITVMSASTDSPNLRLSQILKITSIEDGFLRYPKLYEESRSGGPVFKDGELIGIHCSNEYEQDESYAIEVNEITSALIDFIQQ